VNRIDILQQADDLINNDRARQHGDVKKTFADIAARWSSLTETPLEPADVALMLIELKVVRAAHNPKHADNWRDIIGYAALGAEVAGAADAE